MPTEPSLTIDFASGAVFYRLRQREGRGQALPKAVGMAKGATPSVVDATAGMGRDAFLLASLGASVTLIERNPEVHAALAEAMQRARETSDELAGIVARMTLLHGDSRDLLKELAPEVVFVDPMHPPRGKTALVKKEMRALRDLVGDDPDQRDLIETALRAARQRVVLKWPLRAAPLEGLRNPSHQILGKTTRYDVFMV